MSLYKIGNAYFVRDGNHRVSVARYHGVAAIDAEVVEIRDGCARTLRNVQRALWVLPADSTAARSLSPARPRFKTCGDASDRVSYDQRLNAWDDSGKSGLVELA